MRVVRAGFPASGAWPRSVEMARTHVLSRLALLRLRFCVEVAAPVRVPPYKGDMLRRALLWYLGTLWCRQPERCRNGCQLPGECLFGRLIEPPVDPTWSLSICRLMGATPPPCYVLWDERDRRRDLKAGDRFHFELTLIGQAAIRQTPAFVAAMAIASERGIGRERLKGRLMRVDALVGPHGQPCLLFENGTWQSLRCASAMSTVGRGRRRPPTGAVDP